LASAPSIEQMQNTIRGDQRSAIASTAKVSVPAMNPNCTAEVM
jgi:hypothetical protein